MSPSQLPPALGHPALDAEWLVGPMALARYFRERMRKGKESGCRYLSLHIDNRVLPSAQDRR